jgi:hypothetical protein
MDEAQPIPIRRRDPEEVVALLVARVAVLEARVEKLEAVWAHLAEENQFRASAAGRRDAARARWALGVLGDRATVRERAVGEARIADRAASWTEIGERAGESKNAAIGVFRRMLKAAAQVEEAGTRTAVRQGGGRVAEVPAAVARRVACPLCGAGQGELCRSTRPYKHEAGSEMSPTHAARRQLALRVETPR